MTVQTFARPNSAGHAYLHEIMKLGEHLKYNSSYSTHRPKWLICEILWILNRVQGHTSQGFCNTSEIWSIALFFLPKVQCSLKDMFRFSAYKLLLNWTLRWHFAPGMIIRWKQFRNYSLLYIHVLNHQVQAKDSEVTADWIDSSRANKKCERKHLRRQISLQF